jgi:hypothetical protein
MTREFPLANFSLDSCNENLSEKIIHRNCALAVTTPHAEEPRVVVEDRVLEIGHDRNDLFGSLAMGVP